jgi:hypothetical protein
MREGDAPSPSRGMKTLYSRHSIADVNDWGEISRYPQMEALRPCGTPGQGILVAASSMSPPCVRREEQSMEHQAFDTVTRHFGTAASRRTALRALLAGALLRTPTQGALASPCEQGKHPPCGSQCCPGRCFTNATCGDQLCCVGPAFTICGDQCCRARTADGRKIASPCHKGGCVPPRNVCGEDPSGGIAGSYRRR